MYRPRVRTTAPRPTNATAERPLLCPLKTAGLLFHWLSISLAFWRCYGDAVEMLQNEPDSRKYIRNSMPRSVIYQSPLHHSQARGCDC
jgi:hypothetical protein